MTDFLTGDDLASYLGVELTGAIDKIVELTNNLVTEEWVNPTTRRPRGSRTSRGRRCPGWREPEGPHVVDPVVGRHVTAPSGGRPAPRGSRSPTTRRPCSTRRPLAALCGAQRGRSVCGSPTGTPRPRPRPVELLSDAEIADRAHGRGNLPDTCRIVVPSAVAWCSTRPPASTPTTARRVDVALYEGPCKFQIRPTSTTTSSSPSRLEREWAYQTSTLLTPHRRHAGVVAGSPANIGPDDMCTILTRRRRRLSPGRVFNVHSSFHKSMSSTRRFRVRRRSDDGQVRGSIEFDDHELEAAGGRPPASADGSGAARTLKRAGRARRQQGHEARRARPPVSAAVAEVGLARDGRPWTAEIGLSTDRRAPRAGWRTSSSTGRSTTRPVYDYTAALRRSTPEILEMFAGRPPRTPRWGRKQA
jgi:hypothetical protein